MGRVTFKDNYMVLGVCSNHMSKTNTFSQVALDYFWLYAISGDQHNKLLILQNNLPFNFFKSY